MLYLATVQKKTRFLSAAQTSLKLLACKRSQNNWSPVSGEELIPSPEASNFNAGVLVLVDMTANKKLQNIREAASELVKILQNFSRLQEKSEVKEQAKEQEKEFWQQALTQQSAELNRREMEIKVQQEQLVRQRQELDKARLQLQRQRQALMEQQQKKPISNRNYTPDAKSLTLQPPSLVRVANSDQKDGCDMSTLVLDNFV